MHQFATQLSPTLPWLAANPTDGHAPAEFTPPPLHYLGEFASALLMFVAVLMLAFYWSLQEDRTLRALLLLVPVPRREAARELIDAMQAKVGDFIYGQAIAVLRDRLAHVDRATPSSDCRTRLPLAILSGVLETVPVFGLLASALPAALVGLSISGGKFSRRRDRHHGNPSDRQFLLAPHIMGRSVGLHPIVTLLALVGFGAVVRACRAPCWRFCWLRSCRCCSIAFCSAAKPKLPRRSTGRDHISLLRHEAQELLQDVRQNLRRKDEASTPTNDHFEEAIETIACDLERLLAGGIERSAAAHAESEAAE